MTSVLSFHDVLVPHTLLLLPLKVSATGLGAFFSTLRTANLICNVPIIFQSSSCELNGLSSCDLWPPQKEFSGCFSVPGSIEEGARQRGRGKRLI